jgi:pimeloyl-[acyl-carrier protein] methyl ester esterase
MPCVELRAEARATPHLHLFVPGWAMDWRIFSERSLTESARLVPRAMLPGVGEVLVACLAARPPQSVTLVGWSLGGLVALEACRACPAAVARLVLIGCRPHYPTTQIAAMRDALLTDRRRCLTDFYRQCFLPQHREAYRAFKAQYQEDYLESLPQEELLEGLRWLEEQPLDLAGVPVACVEFWHSAADLLAPLEETRTFAAAHEVSVTIIPGAGHAALLVPEVWRQIMHAAEI